MSAALTARPILFGAPMVRALLAGTKTQTRRVMRKQFPADAVMAEIPATDPIGGWVVQGHSGLWWDDAASCFDDAVRCPYGQPGDRLWVREAFARHIGSYCESFVYAYRATDDERLGPWKPSIHMPRAASRITLEITGVRVERLQDISEADAIAEGMHADASCRKDDDAAAFHRIGAVRGESFPIARYAALWESINGTGTWDANPWVWVVEFTSSSDWRGVQA